MFTNILPVLIFNNVYTFNIKRFDAVQGCTDLIISNPARAKPGRI